LSLNREKIRISRDASIILAYWKDFGAESIYRAVITGKFSRILLETRNGEGIVGAVNFHDSGCALLYLPALDFDEADMRRKGPPYWKAEALRFGGRLIKSIVGIFEAVRSGAESSPPPGWVEDEVCIARRRVNHIRQNRRQSRSD
jgi:hypothetical protein